MPDTDDGPPKPTPLNHHGEKSLYLHQTGSILKTHSSFQHPFYKNLDAVLRLIEMTLKECFQVRAEHVRTIESGAVEEYVVFEKTNAGKKLLFRVWPVFYALNKRIEYQVYNAEAPVSRMIRRYLGVCAKTNDAHLMIKDR